MNSDGRCVATLDQRCSRYSPTEAGAALRTDAPVRSLDEIEADAVVLATPAAIIAGLLAPLGVSFVPPATARADSLLLALDAPGLVDDPVGSGVLLSGRTDGMAIRSLTH